ncbi:MAG: hypothetical protein AAGA15_08235 [Pseudomonadota bacterium]
MISKPLTALGFVGALALSACSTPGADTLLALPEAVQLQALQACQNEQGAVPPEAIQVLRLDNGGASVFVANGPGVTLGQARALNQCSTAKLRATYGVGSDIFAFSAEQQGDAIRACKDERGIPGQFSTVVFQYGSSAREVLIEPAFAVTEVDARAINACARAKLRGAQTGQFTAATPAAATTASVPAASGPAPAPAAFVPSPDGYSPLTACRPDLGVMQGGVAICPMGQR